MIVIQAGFPPAVHGKPVVIAKLCPAAAASECARLVGASTSAGMCAPNVRAMISMPASLGWNPSETNSPAPEPNAAWMSAKRMP